MFKFVEDNVKGVGMKRKENPRPCDTCKKRHKRCRHNDPPARIALPGSSPASPSESTHSEAPLAKTSSHGLVPYTGAAGPSLIRQDSQSGDAHIRFVANLSPESAFIINANHKPGQGDISRHVVGLWLGQKSENTSPQDPANEAGDDNEDESAAGDASAGQGMLLNSLRPALKRECLATLPADHELNILSNLYYSKIDPIFPLLKDEPWDKHTPMETLALKQCICLIASLDPTMRPHLRLPHIEGVMPERDFRARISTAVKQSLDLGFITDEVVLLQVCTLMSMYVEKQGFGELSKYYCAQAVLHEQTLGFHVGWPDGKAGAERSHRIFWCVWVLDRLNAATNGRPTVIHRRDMDRKVMNSVEEQPPPFRLLIRIAQYLDYAISLYRPYALKQDQPENMNDTFEGLVEASGAHNLSNGLLASLELFYLAVVIIRGRPSGQRPSSELQWFCAARIVTIASGEFKSSLVSWPILPYSVTVAASVAYRSLRNSPMPYNRRRAYKLFQDSCEVLEDLSKAFLSARAMARLAMDTMQEVERVAAERTRRDSIRLPEATAATANEASMSEHASHDTRAAQPHTEPQPQQQQALRIPPQALEPNVNQAIDALPTPSDDQQQLDPNFFTGFDGENGIFGSFDPSFDLSRIDAIFSANLDPSAPPWMERWQGGPGLFPWDTGS